ncbi:anti-sigma factor [Cryobacterium arcticum]|uniref:Anti-sigma factor n=1 Tax=Cryobacterium arcticum TaxID=670052 RepID=A0A317ZS71_9MICO|nr:anti-sigma factor [Cryobacterium arcticum]PXA70044.1 anti-sigma factor [Cryobacterium arcticum]
MTHLDRDTLALVALAELDLSPAEREHLQSCPACTGELDALRRTVLIGRTAGSVDLVKPADAVWGRIHAALGLSDAVAAPPRRGVDTSVDAAVVDESAAGMVRPPASVVELPRRRRWLPVAAAACLVGVLGGIGATVWWQAARAPEPLPVIAEAQLDALPGWTASGRAYLEEDADGRREVVVDVDGGADAGGLREVWLLTADATGLVSVGLLDGATGRFSIPAGIDLAEYPVVDVSAEPDDGNPAHSGDSIVRGTLSGL